MLNLGQSRRLRTQAGRYRSRFCNALRVVLVQTDHSSVLKNYKLLAAFEGRRDVLPHSIERDSQFCLRNREPRFPLL